MESGLKVAIVSPECARISSLGGLGTYTYSFTKVLRDKGIDARIILSNYRYNQGDAEFQWRDNTIEKYQLNDIPVYMILAVEPIRSYNDPRTHARELTDRVVSYDMFKTAQSFSDSIPSTLEKIVDKDNWKPDILQLNDWTNARAAETIKHTNIPTVLVIHNAHHTGEIDEKWIKEKELPEGFQTADDGYKSMLEVGIIKASKIVIVGPTYAEEILREGFIGGPGERCRRLLMKRQSQGDVLPILNGINYEMMDPATDRNIVQYSTYNVEMAIENKKVNKGVLLARQDFLPGDSVGRYSCGTGKCYFPIRNFPFVVTVFGRLTEEKGIDLVIEYIKTHHTRMEDTCLLIAGPCSSYINDELKTLQEKYPMVRVHPQFVGSARRSQILAGSDAFLFASRWEPCGQGHLEGMRYGSPPIAYETGGFIDTVKPFDGKEGTGFYLKELSADGIAEGVGKAHKIYFDKPDTWAELIGNVMRENFAWDGPNNSVGRYIELYKSLL